jgi:hypothetical protein
MIGCHVCVCVHKMCVWGGGEEGVYEAGGGVRRGRGGGVNRQGGSCGVWWRISLHLNPMS